MNAQVSYYFRTWVLGVTAALALSLLALAFGAPPAWASSPSDVSLKFVKGGGYVATTQAGEKVGYEVDFTATSALTGGTGANDTITISAPAGTVFPADSNEYFLVNFTTDILYSGFPSVVLSDGGSTVTLSLPSNGVMRINAGDRAGVGIGFNGPSFVTNPSEPGQYTLDVRTSSDTTPATSAPYTIAPETVPPNVTNVARGEDATGVGRRANVKAFFSEAMSADSINTNTVKLFKVGEDSALDATVTYGGAHNKAMLDPSANLKRGATYKAVVSTGAQDLAGNSLDQDPTLPGNQPKEWFFTVRN